MIRENRVGIYKGQYIFVRKAEPCQAIQLPGAKFFRAPSLHIKGALLPLQNYGARGQSPLFPP